jgi:hypothetical protein
VYSIPKHISTISTCLQKDKPLPKQHRKTTDKTGKLPPRYHKFHLNAQNPTPFRHCPLTTTLKSPKDELHLHSRRTKKTDVF